MFCSVWMCRVLTAWLLIPCGRAQDGLEHGSPLFDSRQRLIMDDSRRCESYVLRAREAPRTERVRGMRRSVSLAEALAVFLSVGVFSSLVAYGFVLLRRRVYLDGDRLDTTFDAGGHVSVGLTVSTIASQWTGFAMLLQLTTVAGRFGISGAYWSAAGAIILIPVVSIISIQLKTKAPGAKTFLQVIHARFGARTHQLYCLFAFLASLVVMMALAAAGTAVLNALVNDLSIEMAAMLLALVIGAYTCIGGLGATFYVSYFNAALIFLLTALLVIRVYHGSTDSAIGDSQRIFDFVSCWEAPTGNFADSFFTFMSSGGLVFGVVNLVGSFGAVFCDQAFWQSSVAAKPIQAVWGFILGALVWFSIPLCLATTLGLSYLALSSAQGEPMLSDDDVSRGLIAPMVVQVLLGRGGTFIMLFIILMAVMSCGSAEVVAIASILIYDIYQVYLRPFRKGLVYGECILCGNSIVATDTSGVACHCQSMDSCEDCEQDNSLQLREETTMIKHYRCKTHGKYREYQDVLSNYKNWSILWATLLTIPLSISCHQIGLNLVWTYCFTGILISSAVVPVGLSVVWVGTSARGMLCGGVLGCMLGMSSWLLHASTFPGGLRWNFIANTGHQLPMLTGNLVSILSGGVVCLVTSLFDSWNMTPQQRHQEWDKTRSIDSPLRSWVSVYSDCFSFSSDHVSTSYHDRPPLDGIIRRFSGAKRVAFTASMCFLLFFVVIWPVTMLVAHPLSSSGFFIWSVVSRSWAFAAGVFVVLVPLIQEVIAIITQKKRNQVTRSLHDDFDVPGRRFQQECQLQVRNEVVR